QETCAKSDVITAAILVIGNEILSGRTKDKNIGYIAEYLTNIGIDMREVRVVPDVEDEIIAALDALRHRYTYVFTTGGIGPTHAQDRRQDAVGDGQGELPRGRHRHPARRDRQGASRRDDRQLSVPGRRPAEHQHRGPLARRAKARRRQVRRRGHAGAGARQSATDRLTPRMFMAEAQPNSRVSSAQALPEKAFT